MNILFLTELLEETIPSTPPAYDYSAAFLKMVIMLAITVAFLILTVYILKKIIKSRSHLANQNHAIKILEKRALSPKSTIYLLEVENEKVLVSESQLEVRSLKSLKKGSV